jgi:1-phosphofructokinase
MSDVTIFAPSPTLTVTVEEHGGEPDIHVHAGGQGVWQARMLLRLGASVTMCCTLTGEVGRMLRHLLEDEGIGVAGLERPGKGSAYVHDRRGGERYVIAETEGEPLGRHDLDELYGLTLREGLASGLTILSGPAGDEALPADTYRRLAADLREGGATVVVDLAGERLAAAVDGGVDVLKVSDEELTRGGLVTNGSVAEITTAMRALHRRGADTVIVSRATDPLLLLDAQGFAEVTQPRMAVADTRGAGDSLTAGVTAAMVRGERGMPSSPAQPRGP